MKASKRFVERHGEDVTVTNFTETGTDGYGDPEFDETTESTKAIISVLNEPLTVKTESGVDVSVEARAWFTDETDVHDVHSARKSTVVTRGQQEYRVVQAFKDDNGLIKAEVTRRAL